MTVRSAFGTLDSPGEGWFPHPSEPFHDLWWLARALWFETLGFRFSYPIEPVPEAGCRSSLHYYIYSEHLFFDMMELDDQGIPCHRTRTLGRFYNPAYVAWYGLMKLEQSLRAGKAAGEEFYLQKKWLVDHAVVRQDGSVVWYFPVDFQEGKALLKSPWISAMIQGLVISVLIRAYRLRADPDLMDLCHGAVQVYKKDISEGGIRTNIDSHFLFEEYPACPLPRVLDGFLFSLLGLYDFWVETGNPSAKELFDKAVLGLLGNLDSWNYEKSWSWYGTHGYLCPPNYHALNRLLLAVIGNLTGEKTLLQYARGWDPAELTVLDRTRLFLVFFATKQWCRAKGWYGRNS